MSVALATGLYASHTLVPPTPGPIAAAGNLGLEDKLGYVIIVGVIVSVFAMLAGFFWAKYIGDKTTIQEDLDNKKEVEQINQLLPDGISKLPEPKDGNGKKQLELIAEIRIGGTQPNSPAINSVE